MREGNGCDEFCEACGDCLRCYAEDPCYATGGEHDYVSNDPEEPPDADRD